LAVSAVKRSAEESQIWRLFFPGRLPVMLRAQKTKAALEGAARVTVLSPVRRRFCFPQQSIAKSCTCARFTLA
jgi:hypothetical protein